MKRTSKKFFSQAKELPLHPVLKKSLRPGVRCYTVGGVDYPIENIRTFAIHGYRCACCGRRGDRVLAWRDNGGGRHIDIYSGDVMMNRDHIIPKSKGGPNSVWNYQPMCEKCNTSKGNQETPQDIELSKFRAHWKRIHMFLQATAYLKLMQAVHFFRPLRTPTINRACNFVRSVYLHKVTFVLAKISYKFA